MKKIQGTENGMLGNFRRQLEGDHGGEQGFTLIEVLIAVAIFSIGMLAVGAMQLQAVNADTSSRLHIEAEAIACDQVEDLMRMDYDDARLNPGNYNQGALGPGNRFALTYQVNAPVNNTKTVTVTVIWAHGGQRNVVLTFLKAPVLNVT